MEKRITFYPPQTWRGRFLGTILTLVALLLGATQAEAQQRVHIGLDNGNMLNAFTGDTPDTGTGFSALWRHEQLALTVTGTDRDGWNEDGSSVDFHSTVFGKHTINGKDYMTIVGGRRPSFIVVSLPKGYRILSYKIELVNDLAPNDYYDERILADDNIPARFRYINSNNQQDGGEINQTGNGAGIMRFYEVARWGKDNTNSPRTQNDYDATHCKYIEPGPITDNGRIGSQGLTQGQAPYYIAQALNGNDGDIESNDRDPNKVYTISRTAQQIDTDENGVPVYDMGNELYFRLVKNYHCYGLTIKSFEITFNAEGTFAADIVPDAVGDACSVVGAPFQTSKVDIGPMTVSPPKDGIQVFSYDYEKVQGLTGYNYLYQESAVPKAGDANLGDHTIGVPVEDYAANKHIRPVQVRVNGENQLLYALGSDTYYIEPPVEIETNTIVEGKRLTAPIGYRIVGALFTPLWGDRNVNGAYTRGAYTLKIYKHDDPTTPLHTVEISNENDADLNKVYDVGLCNNDAIKFQIETANDTQALVQVKLLLQALDPYIEKMDIVCTDKEHGVLRLTQSFTADDFSVSGGRFIFYVPEDYRNDVLQFTFSDLYTQYGDETYYGGSIGSSRYSYVTSDYFKKFSGNQVAGVDGFPVNGGLYDPVYKNGNPTANPPVPAGAAYPYDTKVYTSTAGNIRFEFNNAEELAKQAAQAGQNVQLTGNLIEYPFSVTAYIGSDDPDGDSSKKGNFLPCELMANPTVGYQNTGTFFVFTADETRWNIAPTNNWQHRFYAFYRMEIEAVAKSFIPKFEWTKIYDKTCYDKDGNGTDVEDAMFGVKLGAADVENLNVSLPEGYLTYQEIINYIMEDHDATTYSAEQAAAYNAEHNLSEGQTGYKKAGDPRTPFIAKQLMGEEEYDNAENPTRPKSMKQILYVDGSDLYALVNSSTNQIDTEGKLIVITMNDLKKELSTNNLVFMPEGTIEKIDNAAYKSGSGFQAGQNIILTDKKPFFSPYDISVGTDNYATYSREITIPSYTEDVINATVMLPFTLRLENGKHTNPNDNFAFTVHTMNGGTMEYVDGRTDYGTAYFEKVGEGYSWTEANWPYMIKITDFDNKTTEDGGKISFIAAQKGSDIKATPKDGTAGKKELSGESAWIEFGGNNYYLMNWGSYSGVKYDRLDGEDIFYFAQNMYLNLHQLNYKKQYLYSYPFRAVYKYTTEIPESGAKRMKGFYINYDEFPGVPTGIDSQETVADLMVKVGKGEVTLSATRAQDVTLYTIGGITMRRVELNAGDTKTVNLPAGAYMVNGVKIIVK